MDLYKYIDRVHWLDFDDNTAVGDKRYLRSMYVGKLSLFFKRKWFIKGENLFDVQEKSPASKKENSLSIISFKVMATKIKVVIESLVE